MHRLTTALVLPLLLASIASGASRTGGDDSGPSIAIIGASMSAGFSLNELGMPEEELKALCLKYHGEVPEDAELTSRTQSTKLAKMVEHAYAKRDATVSDFSDAYMFMGPERKGAKQLAGAMETEPALVFGLDWMFWFGYGSIRAPKGTDHDAAAISEKRYELQAAGFALIEKALEDRAVTVILGDYPDMSGALPVMMSDSMIPTAPVLSELNKRLRDWAAKHASVHVFATSTLTATMKNGELTRTIDGQERKLSKVDLMQLALLHPTRTGMAVCADELLRWMREELPAKHAALPPEVSLDGLLDATRAPETSRKPDDAASR